MPLSEEETFLIVVGVLLGLLLLLTVADVVRKYWNGKIYICCPIMKVDINDTYGDYSEPDPVMEMEDSNLDYTGLYEEGTTMARDNNSQYEY